MIEYTNKGIERKYFKFVITNPNTEATGNKAGFIDALKVQDYVDFDDETYGSLEKYIAKGLGYIRWLNLCSALSNFGIFFMEVDVLEGATSTETPTSIKFTVGYEQTDAMYIKLSDGTEFKGIDVLKYLIAFVLTNNYKSFVQIFDPTIRTFGENPSNLPHGITDKFLTAEKLCDTIDEAYRFISIEEVNSPDGDTTIKV